MNVCSNVPDVQYMSLDELWCADFVYDIRGYCGIVFNKINTSVRDSISTNQPSGRRVLSYFRSQITILLGHSVCFL